MLGEKEQLTEHMFVCYDVGVRRDATWMVTVMSHRSHIACPHQWRYTGREKDADKRNKRKTVTAFGAPFA